MENLARRGIFKKAATANSDMGVVARSSGASWRSTPRFYTVFLICSDDKTKNEEEEEEDEINNKISASKASACNNGIASHESESVKMWRLACKIWPAL